MTHEVLNFKQGVQANWDAFCVENARLLDAGLEGTFVVFHAGEEFEGARSKTETGAILKATKAALTGYAVCEVSGELRRKPVCMARQLRPL